MARPSLKGRVAPSLKERVERDGFFQLSADLPRLVELDIDGIAPNPEQPRLHLEPVAQAELAASIERHGLLQPILVRRDADGQGWILVAGQRRLAALRSLGRTTVPAIVTSGDPGEVALVENLQRAALDPFETAAAVERLMARHGYSQTAMGEILGLKQNTVSGILAVGRLPDRIRAEYPTSDRASKSLLVELAAIPDPALQLRLWDEVKDKGLTVREVRAVRPPRAARREPATEVLRRLADDLGRRLETLTSDALLGDPDTVAALQALHATIGRRLDALRPTKGGRRKG